MNLYGIGLGFISFLIIGLFHPLVIRGEYYFGQKMCWFFFLLGLVTTLLSLFIQNIFVSVCLGIIGFSSFWSVKEVVEQKQRVLDGRFPKNPNRTYD